MQMGMEHLYINVREYVTQFANYLIEELLKLLEVDFRLGKFSNCFNIFSTNKDSLGNSQNLKLLPMDDKQCIVDWIGL